ncbi:DoxX family protein [Mariniluteicoccus flavus]
MNLNRLFQHATRLALGGVMTFAGVSHLSFAREEFRAQVPSWVPVSEDVVVVGSGVAEIALGLGMLALPKHRRWTGLALGAFYVAIFPGNIGQYVEGVDGFGLDTDTKRLVRLFFQPVLVAAALFAGGWFDRRGTQTHAG